MKTLFLLGCIAMLSACAAMPNSYVPQLTTTLPGRFNVVPFTIEPVIEGTAAFAEWERLYFNDSVRMEFANMGAYDPAAPCTLTGSIDRLSTRPTQGDMLAAEMEVSFVLLDSQDKHAYDRKTLAARELPGAEDMVGFITILNRMTADTLRQLAGDKGFLAALKKGCR